MNILYHFRTRGTGAEGVHISGIANALETLGHKVEFSSPTGIDPRVSAGSDPFSDTGQSKSKLAALSRHLPGPVFELMELAYNLHAYVRNRRLSRTLSPDVIYERHAFFLFSTALLAKKLSIPLIVEVNELVGDERIRKQPFLSSVATWCDKFLFRRAALIVVVSPHLKRRIEALGVPGERILVLPNAVNLEDYEVPADAGTLRERYHLGSDPVIGFLGWLVHWHHLEAFIDICVNLRKNYPNLRVLMVGDGPLKDDLISRARSGGIGDRLSITGPVPHADVPSHIAAMDIAIIPHSNAYRSPIKLFEYMGQGKAVVAPATEPIRMVIRDGQNGILFEPEDTRGMEDALARLLGDQGIRRSVGSHAREDVLAHHTWEKNSEAILERLALQASGETSASGSS